MLCLSAQEAEERGSQKHSREGTTWEGEIQQEGEGQEKVMMMNVIKIHYAHVWYCAINLI